MLHKFVLSVTVISLLLGAAHANAQQLNTSKMDSLLTVLEKNNKSMCSVTLTKNGKILYQRGIGYAKIEGAEKKHPDQQTKYRIGSVSKVFTAVIIFQLIDEQRLELSTTLDKFFPTIPHAKEITIGQLLSHHSGVHDFTRDSTFPDWMTHPKSKKEMIELLSQAEPAFMPGEKGEYSNSNYVLLGYIVEKVTKSDYAKELSSRITSKLGLKSTYYGGKIDSKKNEASSYYFNGTAWEELPETDMSIPGGAGSIISSTTDLTKFIHSLFDHRLMSDSSFKKMTSNTDGYGMGIFRMPLLSHTAYGHGGRIDGFTTDLSYYPDDSVALAVTRNGGTYEARDVATGIMSIYWNKPFTLPTFNSVKISPEVLNSCEGVYSTKAMPMKITIRKREGDLTAQATGQSAFPLEAISATDFQFLQAGIVIKFHTAAGSVIGLTIVQNGSNVDFVKE